MTPRAALLVLLMLLLHPISALAHALDPGYLELSAMGGDRWRVTWRMPDLGGRPMAITPELPTNCTADAPPEPHFDGRGWSTAYVATCPGGLAGGQIRIKGLENTRTDTLVRYETAPGKAVTQRLTSGAPDFTVPEDPGRLEVFTSYVSLGVTHILEGVDHLLFVLALLLLVRDPRRLLWAVTAFTLAHSITLAAATMGWLDLPSAPVEVVITLSIVFLAWELAKPAERRDQLAVRFPALVSFGFGLVHGLGFAGALREIGLPRGDIPMALLSFNIGVETGQLIFIGVVLTLGWIARRLLPHVLTASLWTNRVASYAIGSMAAFWMLERLYAF
ncbi:HupE/UreJ family protein [Kaistia nematophila]|uniref:HupE/UreJ family protein n=1 Tax=Kaistia nematophila TaxID=2994654 RepID=A0A9X3DY84_9HYPH|nr:HupE/UreJ family protein [Kaistia nematophila]MCX5568134.1 HupE/UreJ family protein [Kaistia nematophila]